MAIASRNSTSTTRARGWSASAAARPAATPVISAPEDHAGHAETPTPALLGDQPPAAGGRDREAEERADEVVDVANHEDPERQDQQNDGQQRNRCQRSAPTGDLFAGIAHGSSSLGPMGPMRSLPSGFPERSPHPDGVNAPST